MKARLTEIPCNSLLFRLDVNPSNPQMSAALLEEAGTRQWIKRDSRCGFIVHSRTRPNVTFHRVTCYVVPVNER